MVQQLLIRGNSWSLGGAPDCIGRNQQRPFLGEGPAGNVLEHDVMPYFRSRTGPSIWRWNEAIPWILCCLCSLECGGKLNERERKKVKREMCGLARIMHKIKGLQSVRSSYQQELQFLCMKGLLRGRSWRETTQPIPCKQPVLFSTINSIPVSLWRCFVSTSIQGRLLDMLQKQLK